MGDRKIRAKKLTGAEKYPADVRLARAREKLHKIVDHLRNLLEMHEANAIVIYSKTLAGQIPRSYAAHAFDQFQRSMHLFEVMRLSALWDKSTEDRDSIPTVIEFIAHAAVIDEAVGKLWLQGAPEPILQEMIEDRRRKIEKAIARASEIAGSPEMAALRTLRDNSIAHNLRPPEHDRREQVRQLHYGEETSILEASIEITSLLHSGLNRTAFDWDGAREIAKSNAASLWNGCRFEVLR